MALFGKKKEKTTEEKPPEMKEYIKGSGEASYPGCL